MTEPPSWRRRLERGEGLAFDAVLLAVATTVATPELRAWLAADPKLLYHVTVAVHVFTCPALLVAVMLGHGKAGSREEMERGGPGVLGFGVAFLWCGSFVIPGVLGLLFKPPIWLYMCSIFAPVVVFPTWVAALILAEKRGWISPARVGIPKPWWSVQALAVLGWCYLCLLEMVLLIAAGKSGPLVQVGLPLGILIDYLPVRIVLYYIRFTSKWELATMIASVAYLLVRLAIAG